MFDDPKKSLQQLEARLLAAEEPEYAPPEDDDPEAALTQVKQILARDDANTGRAQPLSQSYVARKHLEQLREEEENREKIRRVKNNRTGGLAAALLLEIAALMGVIAWWALCR